MRRFRALLSRCRLEVAIVVVPLLAILVLQYVSSRRLAEVEVIAHQTTVARYLDAVATDVRRVYEGAADEMLDVPGDLLAAKKFDEVAEHFRGTDASTSRLLFAGALDGCLCLTRYYDPQTSTIQVGADAETEAVVFRANTLLRAGTLFSAQRRLHLDGSALYVDEADPENRAVFKFITGNESTVVGFVGFVVDGDRFVSEYLPGAVARAMELLPRDVQDNLIVRVENAAGQMVTETDSESGQADVLTARFDFLFRDWELSARSRDTAAAQILQSNAFTSWVLATLMSVVVVAGVLLTWRAVRRERQLSRIKNAFIANVSHELRTPVASLTVLGELLRTARICSPQRVIEYGGRIEREADRLRHLIDNVLDLARIESVEVSYYREEVILEDVVKAALNVVDARRKRDGFSVEMACRTAALPTVCVDAQAMMQVFVNLLDNAMKYSGESRRVQVVLFQRDDRVAVSVVDFGIGIESADQARIFRQFYRGTVAIDNGISGTGLGLSIVHHVVHAHGGRITVDSRPGDGSTFTVLIPSMRAIAAYRVSDDVETVVDGAGFEAGARA